MAEPMGLGMSLDDLIAKQQTDQQGYGKQRRGRGQEQQRGQGQGRGGRGGRYGGPSSGRNDGGSGGGRHGGRGGRERQQQPHQQQQLQQQPHYNLRHQQQGYDPTAYRNSQSCYEENGEVVFHFMRTDLLRIDAAGNITLSSGGYHNPQTLASLNDALNLIGIRVTCPSGDVYNGDWSISDGRTLTRFSDGVVLPAKGPQQAGRGRQLLQAFNAPNRTQQAAAAAASNAAATAAGILPFTGFVPPGVPASRPQQAAANGSGGGRGTVFARLGGRQQQGQGRFQPY